MATEIVKHTCKDCHHELDAISQPKWNGGCITLYSCWNKDCLLYAVTLTAEQYSRLTESDLDGYRAVNRQRVERQYKPFFDQIVSFVKDCSGYTFVGTSNGFVCAEFRYAGGKFPMALDPAKPLYYSVSLVKRGLQINQHLTYFAAEAV